MQMILGVVIDAEGRPICSEMWPGNTADVRVLMPVIERLRSRFAIGRVCVVADRGMISADTIAGLEELGLEYVLGARERTDAMVRRIVLADTRPFTPLCIRRAGGKETQLFVKQVTASGRRYIVCRNEAEAAKDAAERRAIIEALDRQLKRGDKALIGNSAYRRYLRSTSDRRVFEIDPGKLADEARYDGIFVLRTNASITPLQAVLRYRDLVQVEQLFRSAKALMRTRPIYHSSDAAIRGHVFCSFLALILHQELDARCRTAGLQPEWGDVLRDLDRLQEVVMEKDGRQMTLRTPATGLVGPLFKAARVALPPNIRDHTGDTSPA
jgi:transposase